MGNAGFGYGKPAFWLGLVIGVGVGFFGYRYMEQKKCAQKAALEEEPEMIAGLIESESGKGADA
ncbi:hypothetical protein TAMA11512_18510 [Selenomonas sp. TAMA-11512]|uniref:hypothetical protein n=1 Tax=Selenomonas sp. TAMA-11512 TaxID=3095337 RepID=UPI0030933922|nr:hypothetical protein TAMA11512_18510 [Selenomonas sp. TAMA-11512]